MEQKPESLKSLFQQEFSKMVAVISKQFGLQHIEMAEDIVSETFLQASETWSVKGIPENPPAWLYKVAKQKGLYHLRRKKIYRDKVIPAINSEQQEKQEPEFNFSLKNIKDSQLQMLFAICTPIIASEAQIGLALRILCGFGIDEIAEAFFSTKDTINKRLYRAKQKLRTEGVTLESPPENELINRLDNVLHVIYLVFNEGYYSKTQNEILRKDFCLEAMRLGIMLTEYERINLPKTNALVALMCFHASRFKARENDKNAFILYDEQDESLWDTALIGQGMKYLSRSAEGSVLSSYHLEARIAYWHCIKADTPEKWSEILELYDMLLAVNYSPNAALNRAYALYKVMGPEAALAETKKLQLDNNHFYFVLLGKLYSSIDPAMARSSLMKAYDLAKTQTEKETIKNEIKALPSTEPTAGERNNNSIKT